MRGRIAIRSALGAISLLAPAGVAGAQCAIPQMGTGGITITLQEVVGGLFYPLSPTKIAVPGDASGRIFVTGLGGIITIIHPDASTTQFLDTNTTDTRIRPASYGLTTMAFHPGFTDPQSAGYRCFYVITTEKGGIGTADFGEMVSREHNDVLYEWKVDANDPDAVDMTSKREILRIGQPKTDHNVAEMCFGPDALLYIGSGDGGNNAVGDIGTAIFPQDIESIHGKILRIDPTKQVGALSSNGEYSIPADNPYVGVPGIDEIYAIGVRTPFRMNLDAPTATIYFGDVGQNTVEELNTLTLGANYGWPLKEGPCLYDPLTQIASDDPMPDPSLTGPIQRYNHNTGRSIVCGYIYRAPLMPSLHGKMILADFQGRFSGASRQGFLAFWNPANNQMLKLSIDPAGDPLPQLIYSLGEDEDGEIYLAGGSIDGTVSGVWKLVAAVPACPGDLDADGDTDVFDFATFAGNFGMGVPPGTGGDFDADGTVTVLDFATIAGDFGCAP